MDGSCRGKRGYGRFFDPGDVPAILGTAGALIWCGKGEGAAASVFLIFLFVCRYIEIRKTEKYNGCEERSGDMAFMERFAVYGETAIFIISVAAALISAALPFLFPERDFSHMDGAFVPLLLLGSCPNLALSVYLCFSGGMKKIGAQGVCLESHEDVKRLTDTKTLIFYGHEGLVKTPSEILYVHSSHEAYRPYDLINMAAAVYDGLEGMEAAAVKSQAVTEEYHREGGPEIIAGYGVSGSVDGKKLYVGNEKLMNRLGFFSFRRPEEDPGEDMLSGKRFFVHMAFEETYLGYMVLSFQGDPDGKHVIAWAKEQGLRSTILITSLENDRAIELREELGIDKAEAGLAPGEMPAALEKVLAMEDDVEEAAVVRCCQNGDGSSTTAVPCVGGGDRDGALTVDIRGNMGALIDAVRISNRTVSRARTDIISSLFAKAILALLVLCGHAGVFAVVVVEVLINLFLLFDPEYDR